MANEKYDKACTNKQSEMRATRSEAGGPANPTKYLHLQQVTPGQTTGMKMNNPGDGKK